MDFRLWLLVFSTTALAGDLDKLLPIPSSASYSALISDQDCNLEIEVPSDIFENGSFDFDRFLTSSPLVVSFGDPQAGKIHRLQNEPRESADSIPYDCIERSENNHCTASHEKIPCFNKAVIENTANAPIISNSGTPSDEDYSETESSSYKYNDSSFDFENRTEPTSKTKTTTKKRKLASRASNRKKKSRGMKHFDVKPATDTKPADNVTTKDARKRTSYSNRTPFLYRTRCSCSSNSFSYIGLAIRHYDLTHASPLKDRTIDYHKYIELIDDFGILADYPLSCKLCPFRAAKQSYIDLHELNVHQKY